MRSRVFATIALRSQATRELRSFACVRVRDLDIRMRRNETLAQHAGKKHGYNLLRRGAGMSERADAREVVLRRQRGFYPY
jgi:hypothetical protein